MIVEDNTGLAEADSYVDPDGALEYFEKYGGGEIFLSSSEEVQEQLLRSATRRVDTMIRWIGVKYNDDQALEFPRELDEDLIPVPKEVKHAVCEFAEMIGSGDMPLTPVISEKYGDTSVTYANPQTDPKYSEIRKWLSKWGAFASAVVTTYRA